MLIDVDYPVVLVQLDGSDEAAARTADTQQVPVVTTSGNHTRCFVSSDYERPRPGLFEFFDTIQQVTLSFAALNPNGPLTETQSEEVVRMAKLFPPGTIVHGLDLQGVWTVISDQDGVTKEYFPVMF